MSYDAYTHALQSFEQRYVDGKRRLADLRLAYDALVAAMNAWGNKMAPEDSLVQRHWSVQVPFHVPGKIQIYVSLEEEERLADMLPLLERVDDLAEMLGYHADHTCDGVLGDTRNYYWVHNEDLGLVIEVEVGVRASSFCRRVPSGDTVQLYRLECGDA